MPQISGIVSDIYEGKTKAGRTPGSPFWTITLSTGNKLSTFNEEYVRPLVKGHEYLFDYTLDGQYCNLTGVPSPVIQTLPPTDVEHTPYEQPGDTKFIQDNKPGATSEISYHDKVEGQLNTLPNVTSSEGSERTYKNRISASQVAVRFIAGCMGGTASEQDLIDTSALIERYFNEGWFKIPTK